MYASTPPRIPASTVLRAVHILICISLLPSVLSRLPENNLHGRASDEKAPCRPRLMKTVFERKCKGVYKLCHEANTCTQAELCHCNEDCGSVCVLKVDYTPTCAFPCGPNGQCVVESGSPSCRCNAGYTGAICELTAPTCGNTSCVHGNCVLDPSKGPLCVCKPYFAGLDCSVYNDCISEPCHNGGKCYILGRDIKCKCPKNFTGLACDLVDYCALNPCGSNAIRCSLLNVSGRRCTCKPGYRGVNCEIIDLCTNPSRCNHGICVATETTDYCSCNTGYTGQYCDVAINQCDSQPCQHGGICQQVGARYSCQCSRGYTGQDCEVADPCLNRPCQNSGYCIPLSQGQFKCICRRGYRGELCESIITACDGYACTGFSECKVVLDQPQCVCNKGYYGNSCNMIDACLSSPCISGKCVQQGSSFSCECYEEVSGPLCDVYVNHCSSNTCQNGGTCFSGYRAYGCVCAPGYSGKHCEVVLSQCTADTCQNGGVCIQEEADVSCQCPAGYSGQRCEVLDVPCQPNPCLNGGQCSFVLGARRCRCLEGFVGAACQYKNDSCLSHRCLNGGTCTPHNSSYYCVCPPGYSGRFCQVYTSSCASNPCQSGVCVDFPGRYECLCDAGVSGPFCTDYSNVCSTRPCLHGGQCSSDQHGWRCSCLPGFEGSRCERVIRFCTGDPCMNGGLCRELVGSFACRCSSGYYGTRCEQRLTPICAGCVHGVCEHQLGGPMCTCSPGWTGPSCNITLSTCGEMSKVLAPRPLCSGNGICVDNTTSSSSCICNYAYTGSWCQTLRPECDPEACLNGGSCASPAWDSECSCPQGFSGRYCEVNVDSCNPNPCLNQGTCQDLVDGFACQCAAGFSGPTCSVQTPACPGSCLNGGVCSYQQGRWACSCSSGFTGLRCELDLDECTTKPCSLHGTVACQNTPGSFVCICRGNHFGPLCEHQQRVCTNNMCANGAICVDQPDGYTCQCQSGFGGKYCTQRVSNCADSPCLNGGRCNEGRSYTCTCPTGFTGNNCELRMDLCASSPCMYGTCVASGMSFTCECDAFHNGTLCDSEKFSCQNVPCQNGGTCITTTKGPACLCRDSFEGEFCEKSLEFCPLAECNEPHTGCRPNCNIVACKWDNLSCSLSMNPWANCSVAAFCSDRFHDNVCDRACNNRDCLYDGRDCEPQISCPLADFCSSAFQDGKCDSQCNNEACNWDGADCASSSPAVPPAQPVPGYLVIFFETTPEEFQKLRKSILWSLSQTLRLLVTVAKDSEEEIASKTRQYSTSSRRSKRALPAGLEVRFSLDRRLCQHSCIDDPVEAASYVGAMATKGNSLPVKIRSVSGAYNMTASPFYPWIAGAVIGMLLVLSSFMVIYRKRISSRLWQVPKAHDSTTTATPLRSSNDGPIHTQSSVTYSKAASAESAWPVAGDSGVLAAKRPRYDTHDTCWTPLLTHQSGVPVPADIVIRTSDPTSRGPPSEVTEPKPWIEPEPPLHVAVRYHKYGDVKRLLAIGADPNKKNHFGDTCLHVAVHFNDPEMTRILLSHDKINVDAPDALGRTPLMIAALLSAAEIADELLEAGAKTSPADEDGRTALHHAATSNFDLGIVKLVCKNARINAPDKNGMTPLSLASREGNELALSALLAFEANRSSNDLYDRTAEMIAKENRHDRVTEMLSGNLNHLQYGALLGVMRGTGSLQADEVVSSIVNSVAGKSRVKQTIRPKCPNIAPKPDPDAQTNARVLVTSTVDYSSSTAMASSSVLVSPTDSNSAAQTFTRAPMQLPNSTSVGSDVYGMGEPFPLPMFTERELNGCSVNLDMIGWPCPSSSSSSSSAAALCTVESSAGRLSHYDSSNMVSAAQSFSSSHLTAPPHASDQSVMVAMSIMRRGLAGAAYPYGVSSPHSYPTPPFDQAHSCHKLSPRTQSSLSPNQQPTGSSILTPSPDTVESTSTGGWTSSPASLPSRMWSTQC